MKKVKCQFDDHFNKTALYLINIMKILQPFNSVNKC